VTSQNRQARIAHSPNFSIHFQTFLRRKICENCSARSTLRAKQRKPVLWGIGGHVIKVGLGAVLIDLMRHGFVSGIAMNGAALIHDFEIALAGNTSEDVEAGLGDGEFGMAAETGEYINEIAKLSQRIRIGYGDEAARTISFERDHRCQTR